jgi:hypothetical protein
MLLCLHTYGLGNDQLHMIDITPVPPRFENRVADTKNEQVLAVSRSCPNGFWIMTLRQRPFSSRNKPDSANRLAIVAK